jgi:hypothetical protein
MCHGNVSSTVPPQALSSSVALTVRESGEHESDQDCEVIGGKETAIAHEELLLNSSSLLRRKWTKSAKYRYVMSKAGVRHRP